MKTWGQLILCLLLSFSIWLIHNLSQRYTENISVNVVARSNLPGREQQSVAEVSVLARCQASGFALLSLSRSRKAVTVSIRPEDLVPVEGDVFALPAAAVGKYEQQIFGDGVTVVSLLGTDVRFRFRGEYCRKLPVNPVSVLDFRPQYTAVSDMSVQPDSVLVYGPEARLAGMKAVQTHPVSLRDLHKDVRGVATLEVPEGTRLSTRNVTYSLDVARYMELHATVNVVCRNVPAGTEFSAYPSRAEVVFRCIFPYQGNPAEKAEFYVDYEEFARSISGRCLIHGDCLPEEVIDYRVEPAVCTCLELQ
ncbi:MAG: YbbR-like domain-containing protein [Bacteroidales bacterium]|nr:YbbR-like domain-containing protein [Bacteroidales bacterium]